MTVFYFGADGSWKDVSKNGFIRRNTCILKALVENDKVDKVFVVKKTSRYAFIRSFFKRSANAKVQDIVFASVLPESIAEKFGLSFINRKINSLLIRIKCKKYDPTDLLWCYWPKGYIDAKCSGLKGKLIFDADHNIIDDPNLPLQHKVEREKLLIEIGEKATYILSSTLSMIHWFNEKGFSNCVRLRNGVSSDRFKTNQIKSKNAAFTVGYCGTLSKWIDYDLFEQLVQRNQTWDFVIIGTPYLTTDWEKLKAYKNVHFLGRKTESEVAEILPTFDVAINLYLHHTALDVDSMKLYEYIAAGVPVVSTPFHNNLKTDFSNLISIGNNIAEIENLIEKSKSLGTNTEYHTTKNFFLTESSWNKRVNTFIDAIGQ
ncbi:glycosyltransferase [Ferruginibacter sp. SUN002]|uniref:glycosyltransferase n=1 Tax=Ferruginibacter sp. SUN002 TaxID=2937789 RepID=UPI003D368EA5